jgi:hypothetical protein
MKIRTIGRYGAEVTVLHLIRNQQLRALESDLQRKLETSLARRLARDYPDDYVSLGEDKALEFVRETIRGAEKRNIDSEAAMYSLLRLYIEFGRELQVAPYRDWAIRMLDDAMLPGSLKVNLVSRRLFGVTQGLRVVRHREEA